MRAYNFRESNGTTPTTGSKRPSCASMVSSEANNGAPATVSHKKCIKACVLWFDHCEHTISFGGYLWYIHYSRRSCSIRICASAGKVSMKYMLECKIKLCDSDFRCVFFKMDFSDFLIFWAFHTHWNECNRYSLIRIWFWQWIFKYIMPIWFCLIIIDIWNIQE